ncbi:MAG: hypothetical protein PHF86_04360 [Candidatus Nanoarchaeia archaeon]|jgi:hypothetical protein|nr:hypothetical protein [Candidatus Nanoarchaeia archaeon]
MNSYGTPSIEIRAIKPVCPLRIGWIMTEYNETAAQTRIRVINVCIALKVMGYMSNFATYQNILDKKYDIAIVGKAFSENDYNSIKLLKQHGKTVYCDLCEDIIGWPWVNEILSLCDKVICCSYMLQEKVKPVNPNTFVIEDAFEV